MISLFSRLASIGVLSALIVGSVEASPANSLQSYILGSGDKLQIELLNIPELSGIFTIGPDGTLNLPRVRSLLVEGLTVDQLRAFLLDQYKVYIKNPDLYVRPVAYRSVRVYVGGEVSRPGYYNLSQHVTNRSTAALNDEMRQNSELNYKLDSVESDYNGVAQWPTLFDALRTANGITPYSDLSRIEVTRKQSLGNSLARVRATVDLTSLITEGSETGNIKVFDGDFINVKRSDTLLRDQLLAAAKSNLSADFIDIFISGRIRDPGMKSLPQGSTLNQAIASAGGPKLLRGSVSFLRFNPDGSSDSRRFSYNSSAKTGEYKNPVLMSGDIIRVNDSLLSATVEVVNEITGPAVGIYSVYSLFKP